MHAAPDTVLSPRRGWIVVAATFTTLFMLLGVWYSYSVFLVALLKDFGWSRSVVAGAFSTFVLVHGLVAPLVGWLIHRFGPRRLVLWGTVIMSLGLVLAAETTAWWHLYLSFGGIAALGVSLAAWIPSVVLARGWFPTRVGTAVGITSGGIGMGIFALVPLTQLLIDWYGWRWAFRILAVLIVAWVLPATLLLVRDPPRAADSQPAEQASPGVASADTYWTFATAVRSWQFWGVAAVQFTGNFVTQMLMIHQVAYLVDHGVPTLVAAMLGGIAGLVSIVGKIGWGVLSDRTNRELAYGLGFGCVVVSIGVLVLAGRHPASFLPYLYAVLIGLGYGVMAPLPPAVISDLFSGPGFSTIFGAIYTGGALGLATGTWSAGCIFDYTGSYAGALWLGLVMAVLSPLLLLAVAPRRPNPPPLRNDQYGVADS